MFLDTLTKEELVKVEHLGRLKIFQPGATIIEEGTAGDSFGLILAGHVEVRKRKGDQTEVVLTRLGPCDMIGEIGYLGVPYRSASCIAVDRCEILDFDRKTLDNLMLARPMIGYKIFKGMAEDLARRLDAFDNQILDSIGWSMGKTKKLKRNAFGQWISPTDEKEPV